LGLSVYEARNDRTECLREIQASPSPFHARRTGAAPRDQLGEEGVQVGDGVREHGRRGRAALARLARRGWGGTRAPFAHPRHTDDAKVANREIRVWHLGIEKGS
jgi:hypothetical protein